jgi:hypothetical protein
VNFSSSFSRFSSATTSTVNLRYGGIFSDPPVPHITTVVPLKYIETTGCSVLLSCIILEDISEIASPAKGFTMKSIIFTSNYLCFNEFFYLGL